jgi:hypothetical protein
MTNQATEQDIIKVLRYMAAAWPQFELTEQTVAVYVIQLLRRGHAADVLLLAAMALVDTATWFPTVAAWQEKAEYIAAARDYWRITANYRIHGQPMPDGLLLPAGMGAMVLGYEPAPVLLPPPAASTTTEVIEGGRDSEALRRWQEALATLEMQTARDTFATWLRGTTAGEDEDGLTVYCRNAYAVDWLEHRLDPLIRCVVHSVWGNPVAIRYEVVSQGGVG